MRPNPSPNADVPHVGAASAPAGRRLASIRYASQLPLSVCPTFAYLSGQAMKLRPVLLAITLLMIATGAWSADQGYFGISVAVDGEGFFFNPTLKSIKIEKVVPNSPAAKAGVAPGDLLLEIEGHQVAGTKADVLKPFMQREVGQSTRLLVKKSTGEVVSLVLVAVPKLEY